VEEKKKINPRFWPSFFDERNFLARLKRLLHPHFGRWGIMLPLTKLAVNKQQTILTRAPSECEPELPGSNPVVACFLWFCIFFVISIFINFVC